MDADEDDWIGATQQMMPATQMLNMSDDEDTEPVQIGVLEIEGVQHKIFSGQCKIGRDRSCNICLTQPSLSRVHAIIEGDNDGVTVYDCGSSNGTRKQNIKLRKDIRYNLADGEIIKLGDVEMKFKIVHNDQQELLGEKDIETNDEAKKLVKKNFTSADVEEEKEEISLPATLGRGKRVKKVNSKYENEEIDSPPSKKADVKSRRGRKSVPAHENEESKIAKAPGRRSRLSLTAQLNNINESVDTSVNASIIDETKILEKTVDGDKLVRISQDSEVLFPGDQGDPEIALGLTQIASKDNATSKPSTPVLTDSKAKKKEDLKNLDDLIEQEIIEDLPLSKRSRRKSGRKSAKAKSPGSKSSRESSASNTEADTKSRPSSRQSSSDVLDRINKDEKVVNKRNSLKEVKVDLMNCRFNQSDTLLNKENGKESMNNDLDNTKSNDNNEIENSKIDVDEEKSTKRKSDRRSNSRSNNQIEDTTAKNENDTENKVVEKTITKRGRKRNTSSNQTDVETNENSTKNANISDAAQVVSRRRGRSKDEDQETHKKIDNEKTTEDAPKRRGRPKKDDSVETVTSETVNKEEKQPDKVTKTKRFSFAKVDENIVTEDKNETKADDNNVIKENIDGNKKLDSSELRIIPESAKPTAKRKPRGRPLTKSNASIKSESEAVDNSENNTKDLTNIEEENALPTRRGRKTVVKDEDIKDEIKNEQDNTDTESTFSNSTAKGKRGRKLTVKKEDLNNEDTDQNSTELQEENIAEIKTNRRGRKTALKAENIENEVVDSNSTDIKEEEPVKTARRGRKAAIKKEVIENETSETVNTKNDTTEDVIKTTGRKGRRAAIKKEDETILENNSTSIEIEQPPATTANRKGRKAAIKPEPEVESTEVKEMLDVAATAPRRGRRTTNIKKEEWTTEPSASEPRRKRTTIEANIETNTPTDNNTKRHKSGRRDGSNESVQSTRSSRSSAKNTKIKEEESTKSSDLKRKIKTSSSSSSSGGKVRKGSRTDSDCSPCSNSRIMDTTSTGSPSLRRAAHKTYKVMFTGYEDEKECKIVKDLGGQVVEENEVQDCNVLVTDKVRRTVKFLCMLGRGTPIVSPAWISESRKQGSFVNPISYIIEDREMERKFGMKLDSTFELVTIRGPLLSGMTFYVTKKVKPTPDQFKEIIECAGGTYLTSPPTSGDDPKTYVISCVEDKGVADRLKKAGCKVMDKEFILTGLFKYSLDYKLTL